MSGTGNRWDLVDGGIWREREWEELTRSRAHVGDSVEP